MGLAFLLFLWLQFMSAGAVTRVTNLTFVNQKLPWNDAQEDCRGIGGHLVQISTETKNNVAVDIDLYGPQLHIECPFEEIGGTRLWEDGSLIIRRLYELNLDICFSRCSSWVAGDGRECWAVNYQESNGICKIFFTFHPYLVTNSSYLTSAASWTLYVRHCYNVFVGGPFNLTTSPHVSLPPRCGDWNDSTTVTAGTTTTPSFPSTLTSTFAVTSNPFTVWTTRYVSSDEMTALSATSPTSDLQSGEFQYSSFVSSDGSTDRGSSAEDNVQKQATTLGFTSSRGGTWNLSEGEIKPYTMSTDRPTKSPRNACLCPCHLSLPVSAKKRMVGELLTNLTLNRTQLSSYRRKHSCVPDDRPLSVGIGWAGVACVATFLCVIIACDATTLGRRRLDSLKLKTTE